MLVYRCFGLPDVNNVRVFSQKDSGFEQRQSPIRVLARA